MQKKKIMIVDDDKDFLAELKEILNSIGYSIVESSNSLDVLSMAKRINPDIILLDLNMQDRHGIEVAEELKSTAATAHIPIIAMSGFYSEEHLAMLIRLCGIGTYIVKPFKPKDIIVKIEDELKK